MTPRSRTAPPAVAVRDLTVDLGGREILHSLTCTFAPDRVTGVLGPNGSGKSTLLRSLFRVHAPRSGSIRVGDQSLATMSHRDAARTIAVMHQDAPTDFDLTVLDTVMLGRTPHRRAFAADTADDHTIARSCLELAGVDGLEERMVSQLSGGQRQRVMLARALTQQAPVLLLDEPSNHLDISHQLDLMAIVRETGATVIAALHDIHLAAHYCDDLVVLQDGHIVEHGTPADVLTDQLLRDVFAVEAQRLDLGDRLAFAFERLPWDRRALRPTRS